MPLSQSVGTYGALCRTIMITDILFRIVSLVRTTRGFKVVSYVPANRGLIPNASEATVLETCRACVLAGPERPEPERGRTFFSPFHPWLDSTQPIYVPQWDQARRSISSKARPHQSTMRPQALFTDRNASGSSSTAPTIGQSTDPARNQGRRAVLTVRWHSALRGIVWWT